MRKHVIFTKRALQCPQERSFSFCILIFTGFYPQIPPHHKTALQVAQIRLSTPGLRSLSVAINELLIHQPARKAVLAWQKRHCHKT